MRSVSILLAAGAILLAGCDTNDPVAPNEETIAATITSVAEGSTVFVPETPFVRASVTVRNESDVTITILPCTGSLDARTPSSRTWTNIGMATIGLCAGAPTVLSPGVAADLGALGSAVDLRRLVGADTRSMIVRARFLAQVGDGTVNVQSNEFTLTRP